MDSKVNGLGPGQSNEWYTPKCVFDALGCHFDLDVAAPADGPLHVPCDRWFSDSSLEREWSGFVWMNPPFGGRGSLQWWLDKFFAHGDGIALTPDRTSSPWFRDCWRKADAVLFAGRTPFLLANGKPMGNPAFGTTLWAVGDRGVSALRCAHAGGFGLLVALNPADRQAGQRDLFIAEAA